jgi:DHA2 family multidrug resistance protein
MFVLGLALLITEMRPEGPIINFRVLRDRNLSLSCIIMFCAFGVVYCSCIALPSLLQSLFGYDALRSGMMMSPSGVSSMVAMIVAGALLGRQVDARWLVGSGLVIMAIASYRSQMNLESALASDLAARARHARHWIVFAPISVAAYKYIRSICVGRPSAAQPAPVPKGQRRHFGGGRS